MSESKHSHGAFRLEEKPGRSFSLLWEGPLFAGQRVLEVLFDCVRQEFSLRERREFSFTAEQRVIPLSQVVEISLSLYRVETAGSLLPLSLCIHYQEKGSATAQHVEVRGFIKGLDCLAEARDFLHRLARASTPQEKSGDIFRASGALTFGFYVEQPIDQRGVKLSLYRESKEGTTTVPEVEGEANYDETLGSFLSKPDHSEDFLPWWTKLFSFVRSIPRSVLNVLALLVGLSFVLMGLWMFASSLILVLLLLFLSLLVEWVLISFKQDDAQVGHRFAVLGFVQKIVGLGFLGFVLLDLWQGFQRDYDNVAPHLSLFIIASGNSLVAGGIFFGLYFYRSRRVTQLWPRSLVKDPAKSGQVLVYVVSLLCGLSALTFLPPVRFQLMVWDIVDGPVQSRIIGTFERFWEQDSTTALKLLTAPGVVEQKVKTLNLNATDACSMSSFLYSGLRLRGFTDQEILNSNQGVTLFLGTLCDELHPSGRKGDRYEAKSPSYIPWLKAALPLTPEGALQVGVLSWEVAQQQARKLAHQELTEEQGTMLLGLGLETQGLLGAEDFTNLLVNYSIGFRKLQKGMSYIAEEERAKRAIVEKVMATRIEVIDLLADVSPEAPLGVTLLGVEEGPGQQAIYAFLRSCGYLVEPGDDLQIQASIAPVSYPQLPASYKVKGHYERDDGPLTVDTATLSFQRGDKTVNAEVPPFGVVSKTDESSPTAKVSKEQLFLGWRYGLPVRR